MSFFNTLERHSYTLFFTLILLILCMYLLFHLKGLFTSLISYTDKSILIEEGFEDSLPKIEQYKINTNPYGSTAIFKNPKDTRIIGYLVKSINLDDNNTAMRFHIIPGYECNQKDSYCLLPLLGYNKEHTYKVTIKPFSKSTIGYETRDAYILPELTKHKGNVYSLTSPIATITNENVENIQVCK